MWTQVFCSCDHSTYSKSSVFPIAISHEGNDLIEAQSTDYQTESHCDILDKFGVHTRLIREQYLKI